MIESELKIQLVGYWGKPILKDSADIIVHLPEIFRNESNLEFISTVLFYKRGDAAEFSLSQLDPEADILHYTNYRDFRDSHSYDYRNLSSILEREVPILLTSAEPRTENVVATLSSMNQGRIHYLSVPFGYDDYLTALEKLL